MIRSLILPVIKSLPSMIRPKSPVLVNFLLG
uniref:Uncharacterized protein n=1 Tax=Arundo donax TaxID=35708 RepID=A0A0A8Z7G4_ARUDO